MINDCKVGKTQGWCGDEILIYGCNEPSYNYFVAVFLFWIFMVCELVGTSEL
jgi:hypothetical protein